jgi:hypothetical protein
MNYGIQLTKCAPISERFVNNETPHVVSYGIQTRPTVRLARVQLSIPYITMSAEPRNRTK